MIPGDPVEVMMGERRVDPEMHAQAMERLGLNKPLYAQYLDYIGKLAHGDLGESLRTRESVWTEFTSSRRPWNCPWPPCCSPASSACWPG
jgi:dipeptide transport system permease protein